MNQIWSKCRHRETHQRIRYIEVFKEFLLHDDKMTGACHQGNANKDDQHVGSAGQLWMKRPEAVHRVWCCSGCLQSCEDVKAGTPQKPRASPWKKHVSQGPVQVRPGCIWAE